MIHYELTEKQISQDFKYETLSKTASNIAKQAHELSNDPQYMSPFAKEAKKNGYDVAGKMYSLVRMWVQHVTF